MEISRATRAPPTHIAPSLKRPTLRMLKAITCPLPIMPSTQPGQVFFLLLLRAEVNDRQCAVARMPAPRCRETGVFGDVVGNYRGSNLVHLQAAVSFRNFHPAQPQLPTLLNPNASQAS